MIVSRLLLVMLLICAAQCYSPAVARSPAENDPTQSVGSAADARRAFDEAERLASERTPQSLKAAIARYEEALQVYRAIADRRSEGATLNNIGLAYQSLNEKQKALQYYNQALLISRAVGDRNGEASALNNIGHAYGLDDKQKALQYYGQALSNMRAAGDRSGEAATLNNIGGVYSSIGDNQKALQHYIQALSIARSVGSDRAGEARELSNIGAVYEALGEMQKAMDYYNQALPIRRAIGDRRGEAVTLIHIGGVYSDLGEKDKALESYTQAAQILGALGDQRLAAGLFANIGSVYRSLGAMQKALEYHNLALATHRTLGDRHGEATALNNIGAVYYEAGEMQKALEYYTQALPVQKALGDRTGQAAVLNNIGTVYHSLGEKQKAVEYYSRSLPMRKAVGDRSGEADTLSNLMRVWEGHNSSLAVFYGKHAVNVLQQLRANITILDKELQKTFLKTKGLTYRELAYLLMAMGRLPEAQQVLNLFKDQQFFDFNQDSQTPVSRLTLTPHEALVAERYEQTTKRIEVVSRKLDEAKFKAAEQQSSAEAAAQTQQLKTALDEFVAVLKQAETEFSQLGAEKDKVGEIADTRDLQRTLRQLSHQTGQKAVAVYTFVGDARFCALVITADTINVASQPIPGKDLNQKAVQLWGLLQSDKYDPTPLAQELYSIVFKPIEPLLPKDTTTILWSLDGNLRYVPMAVLHDGKQYLIERYNSVAFTRADSERFLRAVSPKWTGLGLGSSQAHTVELLGDKLTFSALPGVTEELRVLFRQKGSQSGVFDGEVLPDARFTKTAMLNALKEKRPLVHISSHFAFRPGDEARSFLLLGDGTAMTLEEMKQHTDLFAGVELLTLSACNTAAQRAGANGREIDGFAELAQRLGAGSVMATLWPVADNSTPWLMREFYQTRQNGNGLTKSEAFRRAQLALLKGTAQTRPLPEAQKGASSPVEILVMPDDKREGAGGRGAVVQVSEKNAQIFKRDDKRPFAHPYYWAPFILIGNSK